MQILFWGAGSQARILKRMLEIQHNNDFEVTGYVDPFLKSPSFEVSQPFVTEKKGIESLINISSHFVVAIGNQFGFARQKTSEVLIEHGLEPISLVSRNATLDDVEHIGFGAQVMSSATLHKFSYIGDNCIINTSATVDHECVIGKGVHVMGSAAVAGCVRIEDYATIGTNATILPNIVIGEGAYVGAGAVVTNDVAPWTVVAGVPSKKIGESKKIFHDVFQTKLNFKNTNS